MRTYLVVLLVLIGAAASASGQAASSSAPPAAKPPLPVERIFDDPPLVNSAPSGIQWLPGGRGVTFIRKPGHGEEGPARLILRETPSGKERTLCVIDTVVVPSDREGEAPDTLSIGSYAWAPSGSLMMFEFRNEIFTLDRKTREIQRRTRNDAPEESAEFSPDGRKIAFTRENDIWVLDLESGVETQLTTTGTDSLWNGVLDLIYMEELFTRGDRKAYWWSPDSRKIAYLQFDETSVPHFPIVDFMPVHAEVETQLYAKAGDPNAVVRAGVVDVATGETTWMKIDTSDDSYIARVHWLHERFVKGLGEEFENGHALALQKLNRRQDRLTLFFADVGTGETREILTETSDTWVEVTDLTYFYENDGRFVWGSDRDGYMHLYLYGSDGTLVRRLTEGPWDVSSLDAVDEKRGLVYFTGLEKSILERHVYRVSTKDAKLARLTEREGTHGAEFSSDEKYFIDRYSSSTEPRLYTICDASGKTRFTLDEADTTPLDGYALPVPELGTFTNDEGVTFHYSILKPVDFDPTKKYPVIIYTYGYPNAQVVRNAWGRSLYLWHAAMTGRGFLVFSMDGRGAYGRGKAWADAAFQRIGLQGLDDHVAGARYLASLPYVDGSRIGIWGWSGGGTMTALAMLKSPGVFKAGAAVAPVTDWRLYDSIYTEKFMRLPGENEEGYRDASPVNFAEGLEGALLLAHGTADDNVHMQNSIVLAKKLIKAGKEFDLAIYPGGGHGIGGDTERAHLFEKLTRFFEREL